MEKRDIRHVTGRDYGDGPQVVWIRYLPGPDARCLFADLRRGLDGKFFVPDEPMTDANITDMAMWHYDRGDYVSNFETRLFVHEAARLEDQRTIAEQAAAQDERMRAVFNRAFGDMEAAIDEFFDDPHGGQVLLLQVKVLRASVDYLINRERRVPL